MIKTIYGGSRIGLMIGLVLLGIFIIFILGITGLGVYFLNIRGFKDIINKILNSEDNPIITKTDDNPVEFLNYFILTGIMKGSEELYITSAKDQTVYLVKYENGYYQFYIRDEKDKMNKHPDGMYKIYAECRYMLSYFNSNIEEREDLDDNINLKNGAFVICEPENIQGLIDRIKSKHPEDTITKDEMKQEITNYFLTIINGNKQEKNKVKKNNDYFVSFIINFLNNIDSCKLYKFKGVEKKVEEFININNSTYNIKIIFIIIIYLLYRNNLL